MTVQVQRPPHPLQRRLLAEDLLRRRPANDGRRFAASQRRGRIDPNPHQIDAVVFALRRIPLGGCILADEVGLGKTIEAGLIVSQLLAEGKRRVLLVVPKSLLGQWKAELYDLFGIDARETTAHPDAFRGDGVFLIHRELAGSVQGGPLLWASDPFDLVVIDEAHEIFASIYKRYGKDGTYDNNAREAQTAHRVRELIRKHRVPVLLLTATPIQNNLAELWGLVQYVEPTPALLGTIQTFREIFCEENDRQASKQNADELRRRLSEVTQRTLRRQAQEFLEVPFVSRHTRLVEYAMAPEERALYDDVSAWLLRPELLGFSGNNGKLLLIGFLRRMASSLPALSASLRKVAERMRATLDGSTPIRNLDSDQDRDFGEDLEDETDADSPPTVEPEAQKTDWRTKLRSELNEVEAFIARAESIHPESKAQALLNEIKTIQEKSRLDEGSGKVIIFTESLTTQDALRDLLINNGIQDSSITLFRGHNDSLRAREALRAWESEFNLPPQQRPSRDVAMRLALVHEFKERSSVFISTEAGAKGLNLQFCETLVNYDLPWNPQRIEQRIGRIHRYGQKRPVRIINFIARDNEAQRLTFEILSQKLELFGTVLDASDVVLHAAEGLADPLISAVGFDLESELRRINLEARSQEEIAAQLRILRDQITEKRREFEEEQNRTSHLIQTRLDDAVRVVFKNYKDRLDIELGQLDRDLDRLICGYLDARGVQYTRDDDEQGIRLYVAASERLPVNYRSGKTFRIGSPADAREAETLHLDHPLVRSAIDEARVSTTSMEPVRWSPPKEGWPTPVEPFSGKRGRMFVVKVGYEGLEPVDHIVAAAVVEGESEPLPKDVVEFILSLAPGPGDGIGAQIEQWRIDEAVEARVLSDQTEVEQREEPEFSHRLGQLERYLDDQILVLKRKREILVERQERLNRQYSSDITVVGRDNKGRAIRGLRAEQISLQARIDRLEAREDDDYRMWLDQLHGRRYAPPKIDKVLEVDFLLDQ